MRDLLRQCLQKDVNHRLNSIRDVRATIEEVQRGRNRRRFIAIARRPRFAIPAAAILLLLGFWAYDYTSIAPVSAGSGNRPFRRLHGYSDSGEIAAGFRLLRRAEAVLPNDPTLKANSQRHLSANHLQHQSARGRGVGHGIRSGGRRLGASRHDAVHLQGTAVWHLSLPYREARISDRIGLGGSPSRDHAAIRSRSPRGPPAGDGARPRRRCDRRLRTRQR